MEQQEQYQTRALAVIPTSAEITNIEAIGKAMAASGYFADAKDAAQAVVKILAGREMGFGPFASMTGVYIVKGKPALGANLLAAAVKRDPRYDYLILEHTAESCKVAFFQNGKEVGRSSFTMKDAKAAGIAGGTNWRSYPRNMLFARALSNGVRWHCPDVMAGSAIYTPDELDEAAVVDAAPEVLTPVVKSPLQVHGEHKDAGELFTEEPPEEERLAHDWDWSYFWGKVKGEYHLTENEAHHICRVKSFKEYPGTMEQALAELQTEGQSKGP